MFNITCKSINYYNQTVNTCLNSIYASNEKIAYLTFDDGPTKVVTPKILDILDIVYKVLD